MKCSHTTDGKPCRYNAKANGLCGRHQPKSVDAYPGQVWVPDNGAPAWKVEGFTPTGKPWRWIYANRPHPRVIEVWPPRNCKLG